MITGPVLPTTVTSAPQADPTFKFRGFFFLPSGCFLRNLDLYYSKALRMQDLIDSEYRNLKGRHSDRILQIVPIPLKLLNRDQWWHCTGSIENFTSLRRWGLHSFNLSTVFFNNHILLFISHILGGHRGHSRKPWNLKSELEFNESMFWTFWLHVLYGLTDILPIISWYMVPHITYLVR
jgi:hypothetical protein